MFEIGEMVRCVEPRDNLTLGSLYQVIGNSRGIGISDMIQVRCDDGGVHHRYMHRFERVTPEARIYAPGVFEPGDRVRGVSGAIAGLLGTVHRVGPSAVYRDDQLFVYAHWGDISISSESGWLPKRVEHYFETPPRPTRDNTGHCWDSRDDEERLFLAQEWCAGELCMTFVVACSQCSEAYQVEMCQGHAAKWNAHTNCFACHSPMVFSAPFYKPGYSSLSYV